jgi:4-hydroxy-tetrahydrodipicolinate synthase
MFYETSPAPVKTAMNLLGWQVGDVRLPLAPLSENNKIRLTEAMKKYGLLA